LRRWEKKEGERMRRWEGKTEVGSWNAEVGNWNAEVGMKKNSEVGPVVVPEERDYAAARCGSGKEGEVGSGIRRRPKGKGLPPSATPRLYGAARCGSRILLKDEFRKIRRILAFYNLLATN
jgi:hypothetical protein